MCNDKYCTEFDLCDSCKWDKVPFISKQLLESYWKLSLTKQVHSDSEFNVMNNLLKMSGDYANIIPPVALLESWIWE